MTGTHPAVRHPVHLRKEAHREKMSPVGKINDWLATHLAVLFGLAWTIWVFFAVPLAAYFLPAKIQGHIFFFSSGWIQLFALPLMVYVGNKLQRSSDAQSEVMHQALTHVATVEDQNAELLRRNTDLTSQIHALITGHEEKLAAVTAGVNALQMQAPVKPARTRKGDTA